jgi:UPF0176 protein
LEKEQPYLVVAYYRFSLLEDPHAEVLRHKQFLEGRDVACRIYLSEEGVNGQMSAARADAEAYMEWMESRPEFKGIAFKLQPHHEQVFPKMTIKYRKQLVALDAEVDMNLSGEHLSPRAWKQMLEEESEKVLLDVRNNYEWEIGHFEGAELPACETFRDFKRYAEQLKSQVDPQTTPVMMYCTGGIRCELYSAVLREKGFKKVYQLEGGIINYGLQEGTAYWLGKLFVFDDRLAVPLAKEGNTVIGKCHFCQEPNDTYYNCANMDCNELFLCCPECLPKHIGCCQESCQAAPRVRPFQQVNSKPFRKWYHYPTLQHSCSIKS